MLSSETVLCLLICPAFFSIVNLVTAVIHIYCLGKSKTMIKKRKNAIRIWERITLVGYLRGCEFHSLTANVLARVYWIYVSITLGGLFLLLCVNFFPNIEPIFSVIVMIRVFLLDIPINVYSFLKTKHDKKNGGVTWVWTENS